MNNLSRAAALLSLALLTSALAGCGEPTLAKAELEKTAMAQLTATVGKPSPPITCPSDLKAKTGEKLVCAIDLDGKIYDVNILITSVEGSNAKFNVEVADKPRT